MPEERGPGGASACDWPLALTRYPNELLSRNDAKYYAIAGFHRRAWARVD